ncbi:MAG TPA: asparagine synthase (glutamine-hydrolyzing) [Steroidobacteraceae bacterium]|nr:asparagine synthase (glutamine-hydrolyzing) [Steroidobacteraceae bacterium]
MCGIYGVLGLNGPAPFDARLLNDMGDIILHRGPDDQGIYADAQMLLGMRRLSIIDVSGGHQPIKNEDGNLVVVCNGEIYNFQSLRRDLEQKGHRFATHSDTEVIVHLYEELGDAFLEKLEGMFGLALWDRARQRLIVARDGLGIKPIYYRVSDRYFAFGSEAKSLLKIPGVTPELNKQALAQYLSVGYVCAPQSMFAGIKKLEPGSALIIEGNRVTTKRFWRLPETVDANLTEQRAVESIRAEVERSVREQMVSDVPLGAFLSGGIDSSAVVAFMSRASSQPVKTYSIGFAGSSGAELYNELPYARAVANQFKTQHREIIVQPDVAGLLPDLLWHMDEPVADAAFITTYLVSKFAREDVTVILSGVGGDELFGGYTRYLDEHYRRMYHRIPTALRRWFVEPIAGLLPSDRHSKWLNKFRLAKAFIAADTLGFEGRYGKFMEVFDGPDRDRILAAKPEQVDDCIARAFGASTISDPLRRLMDVDLATQMPEDLLMLTDKMSMAVSLECRVPLLDQRLTQMAARIPGHLKMRNGELKYLLKRALSGILPDEILYRAKRGFGAPVGAWFKDELSALVRDVLSKETIERRGLLDSNSVQRTIEEHVTQKADRTDHLLALINLEIWCRLYLDNASKTSVTDELRSSLAA